ncbi:MAG: methyl-accepting chemotaxis protein [Lachnospiraceae bacterium]|nr:methyl-accepting chemotaxis protein [Lachnospiraceae bacterium]
MKLKGILLTTAIVPILTICVTLAAYVSFKSSAALKHENEVALKSTVYALRDDYSSNEGNNYYIGEDGHLYNWEDWDISEDYEILDDIKENSGIVTTIFYGNMRYATSVVKTDGTRAVGTTASDTVYQKVVKEGQEFFASNVDVAGTPHFAYYVPMYNTVNGTEEPVGMVFAGKPMSELNNEIGAIVQGIILVAIIMVVVAVSVVLWVALRLSRRFAAGADALSKVSDGDLTVKIDPYLLKKKDESGDIARSAKELAEKLADVIAGIRDKSNDVDDFSAALGESSNECAGTIEQVEHSILEIADGATHQAGDTTSATEKVIGMGQLVERTNESLEKLNKVSNQMEERGRSASATLDKLESVNTKAKESIEVIYNQTYTTNESAKKISEAVNLITSIAEETNLLSLNASIEAARAGEMGKGFAVVAGQISKLAEQSNESAKQIEEIIRTLMEDSAKAVTTMDEVKEIMNSQSDMVTESGEVFKQVLSDINVSRDGIKEISDNMEELNESRQTVTDIVSNLSAIAQENAASTEETSASTTEVAASVQEISQNASHLRSISADLKEAISIFKI